LPSRSVAAVVIVAVYKVLDNKGRIVGVKVAVNPPAGYVTVPGTVVNGNPVCKVNVPGGVIVAAFITSLKVAVTAVLMETPVGPGTVVAGAVEVTVGPTITGRPPTSGPGLVTVLDMNVTSLPASALPVRVAPACMTTAVALRTFPYNTDPGNSVTPAPPPTCQKILLACTPGLRLTVPAPAGAPKVRFPAI